MAGKTTPTNIAVKLPGRSPITYNAINKNMVPLTAVPIATKMGAVIFLSIFLGISNNNPKNMNAVNGLSTKLEICPPGAVVVSAEIIPVAIDNNKTYCTFGNNKIPKNIIGNIISGFIPNRMGGAMMCKTAPIPTNKDNKTNTFVFIDFSPLLN